MSKYTKRRNKKSRNNKNKKNGKSRRRVGGGCGCSNINAVDESSTLLIKGGYDVGGSQDVVNNIPGINKLPTQVYIKLNSHTNDPSSPGNVIDSRLQPDIKGGKNKKNIRKGKKGTKQIKGGTVVSDLSDFFFGPSSSMNPITSFGSLPGAVFTNNTLARVAPQNTALVFDQPVNMKYGVHNPPLA